MKLGSQVLRLQQLASMLVTVLLGRDGHLNPGKTFSGQGEELSKGCPVNGDAQMCKNLGDREEPDMLLPQMFLRIQGLLP